MVVGACVGLVVGIGIGWAAWGRRRIGVFGWGFAAVALVAAAGFGFWVGHLTAPAIRLDPAARVDVDVNVDVSARTPVAAPAPRGAPVPRGPLGEDELQALIVDLRIATFPAAQLAMLAERARGRTLTPSQAARLLRCFSFDDDRLGALEVLAPRLDRSAPVDPVLDTFRGPFGDVSAARLVLGI